MPESPRIDIVDLKGYDDNAGAKGNANEKGGMDGGIRAFIKLSILWRKAYSL